MQGKKILIGITASIAAYKIILLVRLLRKRHAEIKLIMTPAAKEFVSPVVLSTLSNNAVLCELTNENEWVNHVQLGRWADVMLIAPLSCNSLAKMAHGICDNLLMATYLSATCPVMVAPAMDEDMWKHPTTKKNLYKLTQHNISIIPVHHGDLASDLIGEGRMAEPEILLEHIQQMLCSTNDLEGKTALVTAGPTHEPLDPVRFIGNRSSGKMGVTIANALASRGAAVTLILGPSSIKPTNQHIKIIPVQTAEEMFVATKKIFSTTDIAVLAAAVADFTPTTVADQKIKKENDKAYTLHLTKTKDILAYCGGHKKEKQCIVGFALETENAHKNAQHKLQHKNADYLVLNNLQDAGAGFEHDTNKVTLFSKNGVMQELALAPKSIIAQHIVDIIVQHYAHKK